MLFAAALVRAELWLIKERLTWITSTHFACCTCRPTAADPRGQKRHDVTSFFVTLLVTVVPNHSVSNRALYTITSTYLHVVLVGQQQQGLDGVGGEQ